MKRTLAMHRGGRSRQMLREADREPKATGVALAVLVAFYWLVYFAAPATLPYLMQRLVGFSSALLAALVVVFADREFVRPTSTRRGRRVAHFLAAAVAALVFAWWLSDWAPIRVGSY